MKKVIFAFVAVVFLLLFQCAQKEKSKTDYHSQISGYTSGIMSTHRPIRIVFRDDIIPADRIGTAIEPSPFSFKPKINGVAIWADKRTMEFRPAERLPQDQEYAVTFDLRAVLADIEGENKFTFTFKTVKQSLDVALDGLAAVDDKDISTQQLTGSIKLVDEENLRDVEKIISATQEGKSLNVKWKTQESSSTFDFVVENITRHEEASLVKLFWNGASIGVDDKGETEIDVPGLNTFSAMSCRAVRGEREYVELRFSDPLKEPQQLDGLLTINNHPNLKFTISGNIVSIFSAASFNGTIQLNVLPGIRNSMNYKLAEGTIFSVQFEEVKPQVRFVGNGGILPTTQGLTIPIETINLRSVIVSAILINDQKIPQFLQINNIKGEQELERVGQLVWRDVVDLQLPPNKLNEWVRYGLDVSPLVQQNPGGIYRITLSFQKQHVACDCPESEEEDEELNLRIDAWDNSALTSERYYYSDDYEEYRNNRENPCHPSYYMDWYDHNISVTKNFLISDLGLIAKRGQNDSLFVAVTDIKTTKPMSNVSLEVLDYQQNRVGEGTTDSDGIAIIKAQRLPFLLIARDGTHSGYLKLGDGFSQSLSHFDVSGQTIEKGIRGFIYGERGVWRPGDPIYLTFILLDNGTLPENHPVRFELYNPRDQLVERLTKTTSVNGFYTFNVKTDANAPTGNWLANIQVGGVTFSKSLKIETIMPNRLKINIDMGDDKEITSNDISGTLTATWLHGALAKNLDAEMELKFQPIRSTFPNFRNYVFDDPSKIYEPESERLFKGSLDENGQKAFSKHISAQNNAPGQLAAQITTRVFEPGGAFSTDYFSMPYHPYKNYVGLDMPDSDGHGGIYLDSTYTIKMARVSSQGKKNGDGKIEIKLYRIRWRWWWERDRQSIADYIAHHSYEPILTDTLQLANGEGNWPLRLTQYGRYFVHLRDLDGDHSAGVEFFANWRYWWRRGGDSTPGGANMLAFSADKDEYNVGDTVNLTIPTAYQGRGLISIESGTRLLHTEWFEANENQYQYSFKIKPNMAPNIYVYVSFLQPHLQAGNDLPIRLYGVIPIKVMNPGSVLKPEIICDDVFRPESDVTIKIKESTKSPMTYTLAIVDEGLLDLTRFRTPNPWEHFYQRQALGVKTWDLYDLVVGAYGGDLEKLLAIGGGDSEEPQGQRKANRFPPMVRFIGPIELERGETNSHEIDIPQYVGSVRVMVVAGHKNAFGASDKAVAVRKPLMVLGTLPRVLSVEETVSLPISVFALEDNIKNVDVQVSVDGPVSIVGSDSKTLQFSETGDQLINFDLQCASLTGMATIHIAAKSGGETAEQDIEIDVRNPMERIVDVVEKPLDAGKTWKPEINLPGIPGTNVVTLEVSRIPPLNLSRRLNFLIHYPYGCIEQTTSSVFPQLYLNKLLTLPTNRQNDIEKNIKAGINRLRSFQTSQGGFSYWPGVYEADDWGTNYAGHFLVEAKLAGYNIPAGMLEQWTSYQKRVARGWVTGPRNSELIQAYRLYTLALLGQAEMGAMNRLKERADLPINAKWRLAAAYELAGQHEVAQSLTRGEIKLRTYRELSNTYGSTVRDQAMVLETLTLINDMKRAEKLVTEISKVLSADKWLSTQTTAYALIAMARYAGLSGDASTAFSFSYKWQDGQMQKVTANTPINQLELPLDMDSTATLTFKNENDVIIYPRLILEGLPKLGSETDAENGLAIDVKFFDTNDKQIPITNIEQGTYIVAEVTVTNTSAEQYDEIAVAHLVPAGWEILNERMTGGSASEFDFQDIRDDRIYTFFDLKPREKKKIVARLIAGYVGHYYLPPVSVEAMYDATINARVKGEWIDVVLPGK